MSVMRAAREWMRVLLQTAGAVVQLMLWYTPVALSLKYAPARVTVLAAIATAVCAVLWYRRPRNLRSPAAVRAALPLQPLGRSTPWVAGLALVAPLVVMLLAGLLYTWGYPFDKTPDPLGPLLRRPDGLLAFGAVAVIVAPVLEEIAFRGWIQSSFERRLGAAWAIAISAALFALIHDEFLRFPILFLDGLVLGVAVYLTRSIWAGMAIHAGNNLLAVLTAVPLVNAVLDSFGPVRWWKALPFLLLTTIAFAFLLRGLWRATRSTRTSPPIAQPSAPLVPADVSS